MLEKDPVPSPQPPHYMQNPESAPLCPSDTKSNSTNKAPRTRWLCRTGQLQPYGTGGQRSAPWGIHWHTPVAMVCLLILAIGTAVGHHLYYQSLDQTSAGSFERQRWVIRIGTGLAFLFQTAIVAVLQLSRKQWIWMTLRRNSLTLGGIDALFAVTSNPLHFANIEMHRHAPLATAIAVIIWTIPMSVVFAPSSITVQRIEERRDVNCIAPTVKYRFDNESAAVPYTLGNAYPLALRYNNVYYGPSDVARNAFTTGAYNWNMSQPWPGMDGCPQGVDCEYTITPLLPTINCSVQDYHDTVVGAWKLPDRWAPFFDDFHIPTGKYPVFLAQRDQQNRNTLWIAHTHPSYDLGNNSVRISFITCRNSVARYTMINALTGGFLYTYDDTLNSGHVAFVEDASRNEGPESRKYDSSWALFDIVLHLVEGSVLADVANDQTLSSIQQITNTLVTNRTSIGAMLDYGSTILSTDTKELIDELSWASFSMATMPMYWVNVEGNADINTTCTSTKRFNAYLYSSSQLLLTYACTTIVSIIIACFGFNALASNGVSSDVNFSTILLTTRNPKLDELAKGSCIGGSPLSDELKGVKMRFGEVTLAGGAPHTAVGLEEEVAQIKKGGRYL